MVVESPQHKPQDQDSSHSQTFNRTFTKTLVDTPDKWAHLNQVLASADIFAYDTETNGRLDRFEVAIVGISFAVINEHFDEAFYVPFHHYEGDQLSIDYLYALQDHFEDDSVQKICHNAKFDEMVLGRYNIDVKGFPNDTLIMGWLLHEGKLVSKGLKAQVHKHLDFKMETYEEVILGAKKEKNVDRDFNFAPVSLDAALSYAADDSYRCHQLHDFFKPQLIEQSIWSAYTNIEAPFQRVLRNMEARGVFIDMEEVNRADKVLPEVIEQVEAEVYEAAGEVFNIGSPAQLGKILFDKLGIGKNVPKSKKSGNYSTGKKILETYQSNEVVANVLRCKKISKTHSTFVQGSQKFIAKDGRIHASFNGSGTVTGRLSGSKPNLQQIEGDEVETIKVRNFFIPSEGYRFVVADYSQIEYRIMAHFSGDKKMLEAFAAGHDFHAETARKVFSIASDTEVPHRKRFIAKSINFGVGYGRGPGSLAEGLGCSWAEAENYIEDYYKTFAGLAKFKEHVISGARKNGYIRTLAGRKRRLLPEIRSEQVGFRRHAERQAFNTKIQGSAADVIKMAMLSLEPVLSDLGAFMCIQIHDELVIEVPVQVVDQAVEPIKHVMENPFNGKNPLCLPIVTEPAIVDRWGEAK